MISDRGSPPQAAADPGTSMRELRPAIEAAFHDLDRWLTPAMD
jgi:hypothetical protein